MALDKQKILNELGSVVNQLQSADCGCMGKMFSNSGQYNMNNGYPSCGGYGHNYCRGYGHHHGWGHNAPCAGEPCSANRQSMGNYCNPPKLYADTYNYLNHNLMQPVVKEVYNDLKSISAANTLANNPMANQMGLPGLGNANSDMASNMGNVAGNQMASSMMGNGNVMQPMGNMGDPNMANTTMGNSMQMNNQQAIQQKMQQTGGMGPGIVGMIMGDSGAKPTTMPSQNGQLTSPMLIDAPHSPHGQIGVTPLNVPGGANSGQYCFGMPGGNQGQFASAGGTGMTSTGQINPQVQNMTPQYMAQPNMYGNTNMNVQENTIMGNMPQNLNPVNAQLGNLSPAHQQMATAHQNPQNKYGQHGAGIAKFNEMFPGVMQGLGGDLAFDPMAIAIQMNPANQQKSTMDAMQKFMMNKNEGINRALEGSQNASIFQPATNTPNVPVQSQQQAPSNNQQNLIPGNQIPPAQQLDVNGGISARQVPQQQVYAAVTGSPTINQQQPLQQYQQQVVDLNTEVVASRNLPTVYEGSGDPNAQLNQAPSSYATPGQQMIKEPIFPADTSKLHPAYNTYHQKRHEYNTLGQPIEMLPARLYQTQEPRLPQTLSPQPLPTKLRNNNMIYSNVKATVSKTSLMGNKPVGKVPSRTQMQHLYNQYKGSQSFTQQNIKPGERGTYSEGSLNVPQGHTRRQMPVEKIGGDTVYNNQASNEIAAKVENVMGKMGDVPVNYKPSDVNETKPMKHARCRNGLQDQTFTSAPSSAAWSFHGNNQAPFSAGYRFRNVV